MKARAALGHQLEGAGEEARKGEAERQRLQGFDGGRIDGHGRELPVRAQSAA